MAKKSMRYLIAGIASLALCGTAVGDTLSSSGTGFAVNEDGWILTNAHVAGDCQRIEVKGLGQSVDVRLDNSNDIALVKVDVAKSITPLLLRRSGVRLGEDIIALGFPLAGFLSDSIKMTTGNVSALSGIQNDTRFLQVSSPIQPGNSGGPLVDRNGYVVGVTTSTVSKKWADQAGINAQNINFAIRATVVDLFMQAQSIRPSFAPDVPPEGQMSTADIAETASSSVYQILCYGSRSEAAKQAARPAPEPDPAPAPPRREERHVARDIDPEPTNKSPNRLIFNDNYDVIGHDYASTRNTSLKNCVSLCHQESRCIAVTYRKDNQSCMFKSTAIALIKNKHAIAGYRAYKSNDVIVTSFTAYTGVDIPGGDYAIMRDTTYSNCFMECVRDKRCKAFSFIPRKKECWFKNRFNKPKQANGVEVGVLRD